MPLLTAGKHGSRIFDDRDGNFRFGTLLREFLENY